MPASAIDSQWQKKDSQHRSKGVRIFFVVMIAMALSLVYGCYMNTGVKGLMDHPSVFSEHPSSLRKKLAGPTKKSLLSSRGPMILLWTPRYTQTGSWMPQPSSLGCEISDCLITTDRTLLSKSDAVVFHLRSVNVSDLPPRHNPSQKWILFNGEAPPHTPRGVLKELSGKINWTASYRKDSDIQVPYGYIVKRTAPVSITSPPGHRKLVGWLVSNCETPSGRERFVDILKRFVPVDVYGECGDLQCPEEDRFDCYRFLSKKYKFYLSFENSICTDYVTEKLFNALRTDMIPVVMGGENYSQLLPTNSYIDALSFKSPQHLAEYLLELDKDDTKYLTYLEWKKDYSVVAQTFQWTCELCRKLHDNSTDIHNNLVKWWFHDSHCSSWGEVLKRTFFGKIRKRMFTSIYKYLAPVVPSQ